jgi:hypothetical protein
MLGQTHLGAVLQAKIGGLGIPLSELAPLDIRQKSGIKLERVLRDPGDEHCMALEALAPESVRNKETA